MPATRFDELTKTLAGSTTRRQALRAVTLAAVGGLVGVRVTGTAYAANSACAKFCASVFGDNTPADEQCAADAAHGRGLCYSCGPASPGGGVTPAAICCTRTSSGYCASYTTAACCPSGQTCQNGTCITPCASDGGTCDPNTPCCAGLICCNGTCLNGNDFGTDNNNCGSCGNVCPTGANCAAGVCQQINGGACNSRTACFFTTPQIHLGACCNGTCTDTTTDSNCGACGNVCPTGTSCQNTSSGLACLPA